VKAIGKTLSERLMDLYHQTRGDGWDWFEDHVTYNNATLPHALLLTSRWLDRADMAQAGLDSLQWLVDIQTDPEGIFTPVGSQGFFLRGGEKAAFDQQPIEASAMVSACWRPIESRKKFPGTGKRTALSNGSWVEIVWGCRYTMRIRGGVLMDCIRAG